jgi:hypothetical protein
MTLTQLERDLLDNASHRLRLWVKDTLMRCDVVVIDDAKQASIVISALVDILTEAAIKMRMDREEFLYMLGMMYDEELKQISRRSKERG